MRFFSKWFLIVFTVSLFVKIHSQPEQAGQPAGAAAKPAGDEATVAGVTGYWKNEPIRTTTNYLVSINEFLKADQMRYTVKWGFRCTGTLFTARFVMTSAQCCFQLDENNEPEFEYRASQLKVRAGTVNMYSVSVDRKVKTVLVNKGFNKNFDSDICILELEQTYMRTPLINIIPFNDERPVDMHSSCSAAAYHFSTCLKRNNDLDKPSYSKVFDKVDIQGNELCANKTYITEEELNRKICTFRGTNSTFFCPENSGSPLICDGLLAGIASRVQYVLGNEKGVNRSIGLSLYAEVYDFKDWINRVLPAQATAYYHFPNGITVILLTMSVICVSALL